MGDHTDYGSFSRRDERTDGHATDARRPLLLRSPLPTFPVQTYNFVLYRGRRGLVPSFNSMMSVSLVLESILILIFNRDERINDR